MCGRFVLGESNWAAYHSALSIIASVTSPISYNIKPTQTVSIVSQNQGVVVTDAARWWFVPSWHKGPAINWKATTFNARIETAATKPTFKSAWTHGRCLIPATGYFEWTGPKWQKQPWYVAPPSNAPVFFFAGLYSTLTDETKTCTIVTRPAADEIAHLHPRMPVMLREHEMMQWLANDTSDSEVIDHLGANWNGQITAQKVRPFGRDDDGPNIIEPDGFDF